MDASRPKNLRGKELGQLRVYQLSAQEIPSFRPAGLTLAHPVCTGDTNGWMPETRAFTCAAHVRPNLFMEYAPSMPDHANNKGLKRLTPICTVRGIQVLNAILIIAGSIVLIRTWIDNVRSYVFLSLYVEGKERMPYQGRFLMTIPMRWSENSYWVRRLCSHFKSGNLSDPRYMAIFLVSVPAFLISTYCITSIYRSFSKTGRLAWLVPWVCIYAAQSTYVVRYEQSWTYPYDFPALAFFAAGLWLIRSRNFSSFPLFSSWVHSTGKPCCSFCPSWPWNFIPASPKRNKC